MRIIIDCGRDSKELIFKKELLFELYNMELLKENGLWWEDSEKQFKEKFKVDSDHKSVDKIYKNLKDELLK